MKNKILKYALVILAVVCLVSGTVVAYRSGKNASSDKTASGKQAGNQETTAVKPQESTAEATNPGTAANKPEENQNTDKKQIKVKALYLTGWTVGSMDKVKHYVDLAKSTEINSYVIDIKDDDGLVGYESSIPAVRDIKAWEKKYDVDKVLKEFHDNGVHTIGRIVCFKDPYLSAKKPDLAIHTADGGVYKERNNEGKLISWLNPYNKDSWPYLIDIAKEAVKKGFDEIQFDYIRFANDGNKKSMAFGDTRGLQKHEVINEFLAYAKKELPGVVISADVFGIICESPADTEGIGQYLEYVGKDIDYISPMAYPSHYAVGQIVNKVKFMKPDLDPYGVVYNTLVKAKDRISKVEGYKANVRPYLQDFTASWLGKGYYMSYGSEQVRQQIKAVYDAGYDEWIFWDANNTYSEDAFLKEGK